MSSSVAVIGMDGRPMDEVASQRLAACTLAIGAARHLESAAVPALAQRIGLGDLNVGLEALTAHNGPSVVLASGDPGFFGIVRILGERGIDCEVFPAVSSVANVCARAGVTWDDAVVISAHGRGPLGLRRATNACRALPKVAVLTAPGSGPAELGAALAGYDRRFIVGENLASPAEAIIECLPADASTRKWADPNIVLVLGARTSERCWAYPTRQSPTGWALAESGFEHRDSMVTKSEIRALVLARLGPGVGDLIWDIGAGSGSVAIECARFGAAVIAVERDAEQCGRIARNASDHGVAVAITPGAAPAALTALPDPDAVFIGGGGGAAAEIVTVAAARSPRAIVVALTAIERVGPVRDALARGGYETDGVQLAASRLSELPDGSTRLAAQNPVFVLWGQSMIGLVSGTAAGGAGARQLALRWADTRTYPISGLAAAWDECDAIVSFLAVGATVRLVAPMLVGKQVDPSVVCVDEAHRFAVAVLGGHRSGESANALAIRVADVLGAQPVLTTATDATGSAALDALGWSYDGDVSAVTRSLLDGDPVTVWSAATWPLPALGAQPVTDLPTTGPAIVITDRTDEAAPKPSVRLHPPSLRVGIGASRGVPAAEILDLIRRTLAGDRLAIGSVYELATVEAKADEAGIVEAARELGVPLTIHSAQTLAAVEVPNPSEVVREAVGTPSVAEAAALVEGGELIIAKRKSAAATVAVVRRSPRGRLAIVGIGPGSRDLLTAAATAELRRSSIVVGLDQYVDQIRDLLRPATRILATGLGAEEERARSAVELARAGHAVALIGSGDAGIYAMASPALEEADASFDVIATPGVTAMLAAAAVLGAPLGHDHAAISLSDLHTPWEIIERRVTAAAEGDFVVAFYNPRSRGRDWQLPKALAILAGHRPADTPVGVVSDATRPAERATLTTLGELDVEIVGMTSLVIVGAASSRTVAGRFVTPRGYTWAKESEPR